MKERRGGGAIRALLTRAEGGGIAVPADAADRLARFVDLLLRHGDRLSLLSRADLRAGIIAAKHLADSVQGLLVASPASGARVLDFGAGAGPVGISWAVLRPDLSVVLLESRRKKVSFLRLAIAELGLAGAEAWEGRGEEPGERAGTFDLVASRGVATDAGTLGAYAALLRPGGSLLLFKGPETAASATALLRAGRFPNVREHVTLLGEGKRRIHLAAKLEY